MNPSRRHVDPQRLSLASYVGVSKRIRGEIWRDNVSDRQRRHREDWPELWRALDDLIELVDGEFPPFGNPHPPGFGTGSAGP
jgi:hypothetical protein